MATQKNHMELKRRKKSDRDSSSTAKKIIAWEPFFIERKRFIFSNLQHRSS
jgi:hypothetical protein